MTYDVWQTSPSYEVILLRGRVGRLGPFLVQIPSQHHDIAGSLISLIGDSNVRRFVTKVNQRACPYLSKATIFSRGQIQLLPEALWKISTDFVILSSVSNFLCDVPDTSIVPGVRVEATLENFWSHLSYTCSSAPDRKFLSCPAHTSFFSFRQACPKLDIHWGHQDASSQTDPRTVVVS